MLEDELKLYHGQDILWCLSLIVPGIHESFISVVGASERKRASCISLEAWIKKSSALFADTFPEYKPAGIENIIKEVYNEGSIDRRRQC
jgi:hypothetical protein